MGENNNGNQINIDRKTPSNEEVNVIKHSYVPPTTSYPPMPARPSNNITGENDSEK